MFNFFGEPFQPHSSLDEEEKKNVPTKPKSPPKNYEEWITSNAAHHLTRATQSSLSGHAQWPVGEPEHEVLVRGNAKEDLLLGSLDDIKTDLQTHARMF